MRSVSDLLRGSKIAQVASPSTRNKLTFTLRGAHYPTHQIIETKPNSLAKNDWGLKGSIPRNKMNNSTRYMVLNKLDTLERLPEFEYTGGTQWNRIRFQEFGITPKLGMGQRNTMFNFEENKLCGGGMSNNNGELRMLSHVLNMDQSGGSKMMMMGGSQSREKEKRQLRKRLMLLNKYRKEFKEWLLENYSECLLHKRFNSMELKEKAVEFLQMKLSRDNVISHLEGNNTKIIGTGGLTYNLNGRLKIGPRGLQEKTIVPGRILSNNNSSSNSSNSNNAAIGGFFGKATFNNGSKISYGMGSFLRELILPFEIKDISMENNGKIHMIASTITVMRPVVGDGNDTSSSNAHIYSMNMNKNQLNKGMKRRMNSKKEIDDLLYTLENTGR